MLENLVTITLDKERHLRLTLKGMIEFKKLTGKDLLKGFSLKNLSLEDTAAFVWASLIHEDKELTYDDVLYMVDLTNITAVSQAMMDCVNQSLPDAKESEGPLAEPLPTG